MRKAWSLLLITSSLLGCASHRRGGPGRVGETVWAGDLFPGEFSGNSLWGAEIDINLGPDRPVFFALPPEPEPQSTRGKDLPSLDGMTQYGCTFMPLSNGRLRVDVWIDFDDEHPPVISVPNFPHRGFVSMLSERAGKTAQAQAEKDCLKWRASVSKSVVKSKTKEVK